MGNSHKKTKVKDIGQIMPTDYATQSNRASEKQDFRKSDMEKLFLNTSMNRSQDMNSIYRGKNSERSGITFTDHPYSLKPPEPTVNNLFKQDSLKESQISKIMASRLKVSPVVATAERRKLMFSKLETPTATVQMRQKTTQEVRQIRDALKDHFLFKSLLDETVAKVIESMKYYILSPGELVFRQGTSGCNFYVVASGHVEVVVNDVRKAFLGKGSSFGEIALLHDTFRNATIRTIDRATLWGIERSEFQVALQAVNSQQFNQNKQFLESVYLFQTLSPSQVDNLVSVLIRQDFKAGVSIVKEGGEGDLLYIVKEGVAKCTKNGNEVARFTKGDFFGEQALLYHIKRTATITCVSNVVVLTLGRDDLVKVLGSQLKNIVHFNTIRISFEKSPILMHLTKLQRDRIIENMRTNTYQAGDLIIKHGSPKGLHVWVVLNGCVVTSGFDKEIRTFESIGDADLNNVNQIYYSEDYMVTSRSEIAVISKKEIVALLGISLSSLSDRNNVLEILKPMKIFRSLPTKKLERLITVIQTRRYSNRQIIIQEDDPGDEFFIVKEGEVEIFKEGKYIRNLGVSAYFGERSILFNEKRAATVKASGKTICWVLSSAEFLKVVNKNMRQELIRGINLQDDSIEFSDLTIIRTLFKTPIVEVSLCAHSVKKQGYALMKYHIQTIKAQGLYESILSTKDILLHLDYPMIVRFVKHFEDEEYLYYLEEYVPGVSLRKLQQEHGIFTNEKAKFYIASVLIILEHIHERNIIYRDLRPEIIMIDDQSYPKLVGFEKAKVVKGRSFTVVGTPHYVAPEMIQGSGYGQAVDFWSLGVILYELMFGEFPFGNNDSDPFKIYQSITEQSVIIPTLTEASDIINQLLSKNPAMRGDMNSIKKHSWFGKLSWDRLMSKMVTPPYKVEVNIDVEDEDINF